MDQVRNPKSPAYMRISDGTFSAGAPITLQCRFLTLAV